MDNQKKSDLKSTLLQLETTLDEYFVKKAPFQLPTSVKEIIVNFGPWITLVMLILTLPILLFALGLGAILSPFGFMSGVGAGVGGLVGILFSVATLILEVMALPGLFKRLKSAWTLLFYVQLLSLLSSLVRFDLGEVIIGGLIGFYILFQVREYYK